MKAFRLAAGVIAIALTPFSLSAQWPPYPNAAAPKTPDGKPNLTAPAPRTADGKPDLSGIWLNARAGQPGRGQAAATAAAPAAPATPSPFSDGPPLATFRDVGANVKAGSRQRLARLCSHRAG